VVIRFLTTENLDQALAARGGGLDKGAEAANKRIEMANLLRRLAWPGRDSEQFGRRAADATGNAT